MNGPNDFNERSAAEGAPFIGHEGDPSTPRSTATGYTDPYAAKGAQAGSYQAPGAGYTAVPPAGYGVPPGYAPGYVPPAPGYVPPPAPGLPNPPTAFVLGFIPGVGAMYNGQFAKGIANIVVFAVLVSLANNVNGIFGLLIAGWIAFMVFDAYQTARNRRFGLPLPNPFGLNDIGDRLGFGQGQGWNATPPASPGAGAAQGFTAGAASQPGYASAAPDPAAAAATSAQAAQGPPDPYVPYTGTAYAAAPAYGATPVYPAAAAYPSAAAYPTAPAYPSGGHVAAEAAAYADAIAAEAKASAYPGAYPPAYPGTYAGAYAPYAPPVPDWSVAAGSVPPAAPRGLAGIPSGAIWLIALGTLALAASLLHESFLGGDVLVSILLLAFAVFLGFRRWQQSALFAAPGSPQQQMFALNGLRFPAVLAGVAVLNLVSAVHLLRWESSWPILLIWIGVLLIVERVAGQRLAADAAASASYAASQTVPPADAQTTTDASHAAASAGSSTEAREAL